MGKEEEEKVKMAPSSFSSFSALSESYWIALSVSICVCYLEILQFLLNVIGNNRAFLLMLLIVL